MPVGGLGLCGVSGCLGWFRLANSAVGCEVTMPDRCRTDVQSSCVAQSCAPILDGRQMTFVQYFSSESRSHFLCDLKNVLPATSPPGSSVHLFAV